jgi:uncharacterized DUF497 family protein
MEFEWDEAKREANLVKHGFDFEDVFEIFEGPLLVTETGWPDERRLKAIGLFRGREMAVIYTMRGEVMRIISVRRARHEERREYRSLYS